MMKVDFVEYCTLRDCRDKNFLCCDFMTIKENKRETYRQFPDKKEKGKTFAASYCTFTWVLIEEASNFMCLRGIINMINMYLFIFLCAYTFPNACGSRAFFSFSCGTFTSE